MFLEPVQSLVKFQSVKVPNVEVPSIEKVSMLCRWEAMLYTEKNVIDSACFENLRRAGILVYVCVKECNYLLESVKLRPWVVKICMG